MVNAGMFDRLFPLPQSPEFARACHRLGLRVRQHRADEAFWQVQSRRLPVFGTVDLVSRGPVLRAAHDAALWLDRVADMQGWCPLLLNADATLPAEALRAAGFWPLLTPVTLALLPLGEDARMRAALHGKWRNRLRRAEGAGLAVETAPLRDDPDHWLLRAETAQRQRAGYRAWPMEVVRAFALSNPGKAHLLTARHAGQPVAAALFLSHGAMATYQIGHSTDVGRRLNAMNLLLWAGMRLLAGKGHRILDLGCLDTEDASGLAHFKLGTGAKAVRQGGTWFYHRGIAPLARHLPNVLAREMFPRATPSICRPGEAEACPRRQPPQAAALTR